MPHTYLIMHKQTILKVSLLECRQFCCLCVNCARINTNIAVDVCAIPDNISELVQKVVE